MYNIAAEITFLRQTPVQIKFDIYSIIQAQLNTRRCYSANEQNRTGL